VPTAAKVGDTFAVPLRSRGYGLCRIVWTKALWGQTSVVALDWFGKAPPSLADARKAPLLEMTHPGYAGVCWVRLVKGGREVPAAFKRIGNIRPTAEEDALPLGEKNWHDPLQVRRSSVWKAIGDTLAREHRFRHDAAYRAELEGRPRPGAIYAVPYHGLWGVISAVGIEGRVDEDRFATRFVLVGARKLFDRVPALDEAVAALTDRRGPVQSSHPLPDDARLLGETAPVAEMPEKLESLGGWQSCLPPPPKVAASDPAPPAPATAPSAARAPMTLAGADPRRLFESWRDTVAAGELAKTRAIVGRLVSALRKSKTSATARGAIVRAVRALNAADTFIETVEREDLCVVLGDLGRSAGLPGDEVDALVDRERDW
jgi:hypothetical protein